MSYFRELSDQHAMLQILLKTAAISLFDLKNNKKKMNKG